MGSRTITEANDEYYREINKVKLTSILDDVRQEVRTADSRFERLVENNANDHILWVGERFMKIADNVLVECLELMASYESDGPDRSGTLTQRALSDMNECLKRARVAHESIQALQTFPYLEIHPDDDLYVESCTWACAVSNINITASDTKDKEALLAIARRYPEYDDKQVVQKLKERKLRRAIREATTEQDDVILGDCRTVAVGDGKIGVFFGVGESTDDPMGFVSEFLSKVTVGEFAGLNFKIEEDSDCF